MQYSKFNRTRTPGRPFACGVDPRKLTFAQYVHHIKLCPNWECKSRFANYQEDFKAFTGRHWDERAMMDGNAHQATPSAHPTQRT